MLKKVIFLALVLLLAGCASQPQGYDFKYITTAQNANQTWPQGEVPRYQFIGDLIGEQNLAIKVTGERGILNKIWLFLIGDQMQAPQELKRPQGVTTDQLNRVFVSDISNQAIFVFDPRGDVTIWRQATEQARFINPIGVAINAKGNLLVVDTELAGVFELSPQGIPVSKILHPSLIRPTGIAVDLLTNEIYVADTKAHDIKKFSGEGQLIEVIGKRGVELGEFNFPTHLAIKDQQLLVSDTMNARVQRINLVTDEIIQFGRRGLKMGNLSRPKGVAFDSDDNVYVIESYFDHLLVYNKDSKFLMPLGGTGYGAGEFYLPGGVWVDGRDRLYIADMMNGRVSVFQFLGSQ